jgi:VanZ family protein
METRADKAASSILNPQSILWYWLPPLLWMAAMFGFSTDAFSADNTGSRLYGLLHLLFPAITDSQYETIHFLIRKAGHFTEYALLAALWFRAFWAGSQRTWHWRWAAQAFAIIAVWALLDEWHQTFTAHRTGSIYDSLLDMSGGLTALLGLWLLQRQRLRA